MNVHQFDVGPIRFVGAAPGSRARGKRPKPTMPRRASILGLTLLLLISGCEMRDRPLAEATDVLERAVSLYEDRSYSQAESLFVQALSVFEQAGQTYSAVEANRYLGQLYLGEGRFFTALGRFDTALHQAESVNDFRTEMMLHALMGDTYTSLARYQAAMSSYREAHRLSSAFNDLEVKASLEMRMGKVSMFAGHLDDAFSLYQSSFSYYQGTGGRSLAEALGGLGDVLYLQKKFDAAQTSYSQARSILPRDEHVLLDAQLRLGLGLIQKAAGKYNEALQWFRDAVNMLRSKRAEPGQEIVLLFHIGSVYMENGRYEEARKYFAEAERLARSVGDGIAEGYLRLFDVRCDEEALSANQRIREISRLVQQYQEVVQEFRSAGHRTGEAFALAQVGRLYESVGSTSKARDEFREAIELDEAALGDFIIQDDHSCYLESLRMHEERLSWYARLANILIQLKSKEEALVVLELGLQRSLASTLQEVQIAIRHPNLKNDVAKARSTLLELRMLQTEQSSILGVRRGFSVNGIVNSLHTRISSLQRELTTLSNRITGQYPNYEPLLQPSPVKIREIQANIPPGTLVIRFLPADDQLHIFALTRTRFEVKSTIVTREKLVSLVAEYKSLLNDPSVYTGTAGEASVTTMTRFATLSTQLYNYFLRPIDSMLEQNLVIIASPEFEGIPFHAIERQDRSGSVKYLIEITGVDYLPSLSSLRFKTTEAEHLSRIVALGNPTGKNWSIDYELRDIRSFYKEAVIFIGNEASWENLRQAKADVLQVSTDFLMGEGDSSLGTVALAKTQAPEEVTKVAFERLTEIDAPTLVLLSNQYGQGVGLSTNHALALRMNGSSDIFLNAWFSERKAAKFFSEFFYTHLANGLAPGDAYRQAILNLIRTRDVSHPHSWGQFFHYGLG